MSVESTVAAVELYTPDEVSEMMRGKISAWTIRKLAREKKIEHVRIDRGKILFTHAQVSSFLESRTQTVLAGPTVSKQVDTLAFRGTSRSRKAHGASAAG